MELEKLMSDHLGGSHFIGFCGNPLMCHQYLCIKFLLKWLACHMSIDHPCAKCTPHVSVRPKDFRPKAEREFQWHVISAESRNRPKRSILTEKQSFGRMTVFWPNDSLLANWLSFLHHRIHFLPWWHMSNVNQIPLCKMNTTCQSITYVQNAWQCHHVGKKLQGKPATMFHVWKD